MAIEKEKEQENEEVGKQGGASSLKIVILSVVLALVIGGGLVGTTFYFVSNMNTDEASSAKNSADEAAEEDEAEAESEPLTPPQYYSMDPKFVVSFSNQKSARFMQFSLEIMTRDAEVIKQIEAHTPVIRSSLLMLFGSQTYEDMVTREGKQRLLNNATEDINAALLRISGEDELESSVEAAYFSSFVIQ